MKDPFSMLEIFYNRSFALLWTGQSISMFGLALYTTALPFLVFEAGGGAVELGVAQTFFIVPQLFALLASGVYVDRWPKKHILVISDLLKASAVAFIALMIIRESLMLGHIYFLTSVLGIVSTFYQPAIRSVTPQIVKKNHVMRANSLRSFSQQISEMVGPALGGLLISSMGLYIAYSINTVTFILSALFIAAMAIPSSYKDEYDGSASVWNDFKQGIKYMISIPWLAGSILIASLTNMGIASFDVIILPVYAESTYDGVSTYGFFLTFMAIGSVICVFTINKLSSMAKRGVLYYLFLGDSGIFILLLAFKPDLIVS